MVISIVTGYTQGTAHLIEQRLDLLLASCLLVLERICFRTVEVRLACARYKDTRKAGVVPDREDILERAESY